MQTIEFSYTGPHERSTAADFRFINPEGPCIVFCHGFKGYKDWGHFNLVANRWAELGYRVLKFNFSFNGGTSENPIDFSDLDAFAKNSYLKEVVDLNYVIDFLRSPENAPAEIRSQLQYFKVDKIAVIGHSRGAGVAAISSAEKQVQAFAGWAGVSDFESRLPKQAELNQWKATGVRYILNGRTKQKMPMNYSFVEDFILNIDRLDISKAVNKLEEKAIWLHGDEDEAIPYESALELKDKCEWLTLYPISNANHTFGGNHPYDRKTLPVDTERAIQITHDFFLQKLK